MCASTSISGPRYWLLWQCCQGNTRPFAMCSKNSPPRSDDPGQEDFATRFDQECRLLRDLKHPCIVRFLGLVPDPHNHRPILLMELMEESLTHLLECSSNPLPYHIQVNITHDITLALAYLHTNRVIHRDLSSNNVLINAGS